MRIREEINTRVASHGLVPAIEASMRFEAKQLDHPQAKVFGCEPDYNVWEQCVNEKPSANPESATLRTAGGHIHVSFLVGDKVPQHPDNISEMETMVMALDMFLGLPFSIMDKDTERRKLYGKAGAFRPKPYGIEYRVLSNYWTRSPELMGYAYDQVLLATSQINRWADPHAKLKQFKNSVYAAINNGANAEAHALMEHFGISMPSAYRAAA